MSTRLAYACITLLTLWSLTGCVDPAKAFDERKQVPAPVPEVCAGTSADITGQFYLTIDPVPILQGTLIHYLADVVFTDAGGSFVVDFTLTALAFDTLMPVAGHPPSSSTDLPSVKEGIFVVPLGGLTIPAAANPVTGGDVMLEEGSELVVSIQDADFFAGLVNGNTDLGTKLDTSTFGAQRIADGTVGTALPAPQANCEKTTSPAVLE